MKTWVNNAIDANDSMNILNEGAKLYRNGEYKEALNYYQIAALMGNKQALSNLGCSYMYAKGVEENMELAYYYFKLSADTCIDSIIKLGNMYESGSFVKKSQEIADYYYEKAVKKAVIDDVAVEYPSLFYTMAKKLIKAKEKNKHLIFSYLMIARMGYDLAIENGEAYYQKNLDDVEKIIDSAEFVEVRAEFEDEESYDDFWDL